MEKVGSCRLVDPSFSMIVGDRDPFGRVARGGNGDAAPRGVVARSPS